jgi:class 3 adenylate cyclase/predicted ATPase
MLCPSCKRDNPFDAAFCEQCGSKLELICPACKAAVSPGARFCKKCGFPIGSPGPASTKKTTDGQIRVAETSATENLEGERKTVTALFADIKGSMELMEDLDPEEARAIVDPALKLTIDAAHHYDGYIVQSTGDGVFALFGAPVAHEDHPQRALYAALRMQEEFRRYSDRLRSQGKPPLQARVGVNTGEAVVRTIRTDESHTEYTPIGHSTSLASRMQTLAPVGSIATTDATRKLCEGYFAFKSLGTTVVKGVSDPVPVFEVTGLGPLRTRLQHSAARGLTKFVGREHEMEALAQAAERAKAGRGQIVAAMAEAGTGKSRLYFEFKAKNQSGWMVLEAFSVSHGKASAYLPLLELLREYMRISAGDDLRTRREKVTGRILALDRALEDTLPYLFALLGLNEGDDPLAQMDPHTRRRRMHDAIKRILLRESLSQPLMVIFEDLHWIDSETQTLLSLLVDSIGTARILLLVNYRPEYQHQWSNRTHYTQLRLDPLGGANADAMLSGLLGDDADLIPLKLLIISRTEGNPFFMEETVQVLLDEGALVRNGGTKLTRPLNELKIPPTVQAILAARIDRLSPADKDLLQTMAVIGKDAPLTLIGSVTGKSMEQLEPMLANLQLEEFIYEQPSFGDAEYTFKHALTLEVAYNSLLAQRRRVIHQQTAQAIETIHSERLEDHYSELAHHSILGSDAEKGVRYARLAAEQAVARSAYEEAGSMLDAALKLLERMPESVERMRVELPLRNLESHMAFVRYGASSRQREAVINRLCEIAEKLGEPDQVAHGLINLLNLHFPRGEASRGLEVAGRCLELAKSVGDTALLADAEWQFGLLSESCGNLLDSLAYQESATHRAAQLDHSISMLGFLFSSAFPVHLATSLILLGQVGDAIRMAEEALRNARESGHLFSLGHALNMAGGWLGRYRREPELARVLAEETIALSEEHGMAEWLPWGHFHHGWALAELGQLEEGIAEMEAGIAGFREMGGVPRQQYAIACLARSMARTGRTQESLVMLNEALAHVEHSGEKVDLAEMLRLKSEVILTHDPSAIDDAERDLRAALDVARAQGAKWWQLRTATSLARLLRDTNRGDEARAMLSEIYNWFTEGFDTADLKDAKTLLDQLGA